jgi:hypothetical protein
VSDADLDRRSLPEVVEFKELWKEKAEVKEQLRSQERWPAHEG